MKKGGIQSSENENEWSNSIWKKSSEIISLSVSLCCRRSSSYLEAAVCLLTTTLSLSWKILRSHWFSASYSICQRESELVRQLHNKPYLYSVEFCLENETYRRFHRITMGCQIPQSLDDGLDWTCWELEMSKWEIPCLVSLSLFFMWSLSHLSEYSLLFSFSLKLYFFDISHHFFHIGVISLEQ